MADEPLAAKSRVDTTDRGVAALGTAASFGALFSAAACCVLPLALGAIGLGAGGLATIVPFHWPLTIAASVAVAVGWLLFGRTKSACARNANCGTMPPTRATFVMLCLATLFVTLSALWPAYIETPLMRPLGGA